MPQAIIERNRAYYVGVGVRRKVRHSSRVNVQTIGFIGVADHGLEPLREAVRNSDPGRQGHSLGEVERGLLVWGAEDPGTGRGAGLQGAGAEATGIADRAEAGIGWACETRRRAGLVVAVG